MADYDLPAPLTWPPGIVGPVPAHALTESAEWGRQRVRDWAERKRLIWSHADDWPIETHIPVPWREVPLSLVTGAAAVWLCKAQAAGGEVKAVMAGPAVMLVVKTPRISATWLNGRTMGANDGTRKYTLAEALEAIQSAA